MALPGLDISLASEERESAPAPPTQVSLAKGSEWRFEVAFGTTVRVKVRKKKSACLACMFKLRVTLLVLTYGWLFV